jgi:hypothetical protein
MVILETSAFARRVDKLLDSESYRLLQLRLAADPECGLLIAGTGGIQRCVGAQQDEESGFLRRVVEEGFR